MSKKLLFLLMAIALVCTPIGCGDDDESDVSLQGDLQGVWRVTKMSVEIDGTKVEISFPTEIEFEDETVTIDLFYQFTVNTIRSYYKITNSEYYNGVFYCGDDDMSYTVSGNTIITDYGNPTFTISGNNLTLTFFETDYFEMTKASESDIEGAEEDCYITYNIELLLYNI